MSGGAALTEETVLTEEAYWHAKPETNRNVALLLKICPGK